MKVMIQSRTNLYTCPGGDTIQLIKTKEYLEKLGLEIDINIDLEPDLSGYDLVHLSNLTRVQETYIQALNAKKQNKPIVLSTIYWPSQEFEKYGQYGMRKIISKFLSVDKIESLKAFYKYNFRNEKNKGTKYLINHKFTDMQKEILSNSDWFLPNSKLEMDMIENYIGFKSDNYTVVPNAVDIDISQKNTDYDFSKYKGYILSVGRIETRKNQLNLLKALEGSEYKLLLVGKIAPGHKKYGNEVLQIINNNPNMEHIESIDNTKLYSLYKQCKLHVLPSWYETPGLVSIEAATMGCGVVVSDRGTTRDYFGEYAYYCDPGDVKSIKRAIQNAYKNPKDISKLQKIIFEQYTWENAAKMTMEGYYKAMSIRK